MGAGGSARSGIVSFSVSRAVRVSSAENSRSPAVSCWPILVQFSIHSAAGGRSRRPSVDVGASAFFSSTVAPLANSAWKRSPAASPSTATRWHLISSASPSSCQPGARWNSHSGRRGSSGLPRASSSVETGGAVRDDVEVLVDFERRRPPARGAAGRSVDPQAEPGEPAQSTHPVQQFLAVDLPGDQRETRDVQSGTAALQVPQDLLIGREEGVRRGHVAVSAVSARLG